MAPMAGLLRGNPARRGGHRLPSALAALVATLGLGIAAAQAAPPTDPAAAPAAPASAPAPGHLFGEYLAAHHAQQVRDFRAAAGLFDKALAADPSAPELI